jgi:hypothetical protein
MLRIAIRIVDFGADRLGDVNVEVFDEAEIEGSGSEIKMELAASKVSAWRTLILGGASDRDGENGTVGPSFVLVAVDRLARFDVGE